MCLVIVGIGVVAEAPLLLGANREEYYSRGGTAPQIVWNSSRFVAGLDPVAGGTWLGINEHGVAIAVANRPRALMPAQPRSRGLLVRELLGCRDAAAAMGRAWEELRSDRYAGCNLLCADVKGAVVLHAGDKLESRTLDVGFHAFTAKDVDDSSDRRIAHSLGFLHEERPRDIPSAVAALERLCADTKDPVICLHGEERGTVSSSIIAVGQERANSVYWHCQGPPDRNEYADYSQLLRALLAAKH